MTSIRSVALIGAALVALAGPHRLNAENVSQPAPATVPMGTGPYKAVMQADPSLPTHTLYRPADLAAAPGKLPIVAWGEGACANEGNRFRWFLSEIASHGYLVIATGPIGPASVETWRETPPPAPGAPPPTLPTNLPPPPTHSSQLVDAIDWALAQNNRPDSAFYRRLDAGKIAVMGMSCGGVQAIEVSADPRVTTTVVMNSGLLPDKTTMGGGRVLTKDDLKLIHAPVAYISGDASDIAFTNGGDDFSRLEHVPALRAYRRGTTHAGTYGEANGGDFGKVATAWLAWRLKGDAAAGRMFLGADCGLCKDPHWVVERKNLR